MNWRGKEIETIGDLNDAVLAIAERGSRQEAQEFMRLYRAENEYAGRNVGYLAGYCGAELARRIWDWFECEHPIFGTEIPTPEKAFEAGRRAMMGEFDE
jgi:hypothetical protein